MKYVLILMMILFSSQAVAINCAQAPDCAELGYSNVDDPNCKEEGYLYCPFDSNYKKCVELNCQGLGYTNTEKSGWCKNIAVCPSNPSYTACIKATCEIGDVFYADGSCGLAEDYAPSNKTKIPVGVVYYVTDGGYHGRVLNLYSLTSDSNGNFDPAHPYDGNKHGLYWGLFETDTGLKNYTMTFTPDFDQAKEETQIAAEASSTKAECFNRTYQEHTEEYNQYCQATAAKATLAFYPPDVSPENNIVGQGRWFMPTFADLFYMQGFDAEKVLPYQFNNSGIIGDVRQKLNETFSHLKDKGIKSEGLQGYWHSITEQDANIVFSMKMDDGTKNNHQKNNDFLSRAILAF